MCEKIINKKISIVIPVYNAEKYLDRCLQSVIHQSYDNWEIIAVDDGSKDKSLEIMKKYSSQDRRIFVIHQRNLGAGAARNEGIKKATGDYIVFIDSDDYVEENYFKLLSCHDEDVVFINVNRRNENGKIISVESLSKYKICSRDEIIRNQMTGKMLWGGVRKAVKRCIIHDNSILYSRHRVGEEAIYSFELMINAETIGFINTAVYNYEVHKNSLSQAYDDDPWGGVSIELKKRIEELGLISLYGNTINAFIVTAGMVSLDKMANVYKLNEYKEKARKRIELMEASMDPRYPIDKENMDLKARILSIFALQGNATIIYCISRIRSFVRKIRR